MTLKELYSSIGSWIDSLYFKTMRIKAKKLVWSFAVCGVDTARLNVLNRKKIKPKQAV